MESIEEPVLKFDGILQFSRRAAETQRKRDAPQKRLPTLQQGASMTPVFGVRSRQLPLSATVNELDRVSSLGLVCGVINTPSLTMKAQ